MMSKLSEARQEIRSATSSTTVLSGIGDGPIYGKNRAGRTVGSARAEGSGGGWLNKHVVDHSHDIYAYTTDVPTTTSVRNLCEDLTNVAKAADEDISRCDENIQKIISAILQTSDVAESFSSLVNVLNVALEAEQSSHRRFEQLVQTLLAAQSEVKALYDTIDKAIETATKTATSGALGQIEDKGKEIALAIEKQHGELQKRIESEASRKTSDICDAACAQFAQAISAKSEEIEKQARQRLDVAVEESAKRAKDDLTRQTGDLLTSRQREFAEACSKLEKDAIESAGAATNDLFEKFRETVKQKLSELSASTVAEMERKLDQLCQDAVAQAQKSVCEKIDEIGQAEADKFSQSMTKLMEDRVSELLERTTSAVQQLNVDLQAQIPALFRVTEAPSTFGARLKWLLLGKV